MTRIDGLTDHEGRVMDAVVTAYHAFADLPVEHVDDMDNVREAVHRIQDLLATRIARRAFPGGWYSSREIKRTESQKPSAQPIAPRADDGFGGNPRAHTGPRIGA